MMNSKLYRRNALKKSTPLGIYGLILRRYWKTLIGTAGTWFLCVPVQIITVWIAELIDHIKRYDFVTFPNGIFSSTIIAGVIPGAGLTKTLE